MEVKEKLEELVVGLTGDKINLAAKLGIIIGHTGLINTEKSFYGLFFIPLLFTSYAIFGYTDCGLTTLKFYKITNKHIKKHKKLDKRFAKILIKQIRNENFIGYCQIQGIYLAAKKHNQLEVFNDLKRTYSKNLIPNF